MKFHITKEKRLTVVTGREFNEQASWYSLAGIKDIPMYHFGIYQIMGGTQTLMSGQFTV